MQSESDRAIIAIRSYPLLRHDGFRPVFLDTQDEIWYNIHATQLNML